VHKTTSTDDKRLQNTLKRLGVNTIPGIEEVNIFLENDLINFTNPKGAPLSFLWCCADLPARDRPPLRSSTYTDSTSRRRRMFPEGDPFMSSCEARSPHLTVLLCGCSAVQASIAANTYVVSGPAQTKSEPPTCCMATPR
jgi:hypothetical protein